MSGPLLDEKILSIAQCFREAGIPHAFGGALALAYYATPRGTQDIDLNVFLPTAEAERTLDALAALGVDRGTREERARLPREGQIRVFWDHTPVDLFFAYDPLHDSCVARKQSVPFGEQASIDILSAEDLAIFKILFDRAKDWSDLEEMLYALGGDFDADYVRSWLDRIVEPDDSRRSRFQELLRGDAPTSRGEDAASRH